MVFSRFTLRKHHKVDINDIEKRMEKLETEVWNVVELCWLYLENMMEDLENYIKTSEYSKVHLETGLTTPEGRAHSLILEKKYLADCKKNIERIKGYLRKCEDYCNERIEMVEMYGKDEREKERRIWEWEGILKRIGEVKELLGEVETKWKEAEAAFNEGVEIVVRTKDRAALGVLVGHGVLGRMPDVEESLRKEILRILRKIIRDL